MARAVQRKKDWWHDMKPIRDDLWQISCGLLESLKNIGVASHMMCLEDETMDKLQDTSF